jgi:hypothetical protein
MSGVAARTPIATPLCRMVRQWPAREGETTEAKPPRNTGGSIEPPDGNAHAQPSWHGIPYAPCACRV